MMRISCDHWTGFSGTRRQGEDDCIDGEIPSGSNYYMITFSSASGDGSSNLAIMHGGFHFCRACMRAAAQELTGREDLGTLEIRSGKVYP